MQALSGLTYMGQHIPVYEEYVNETTGNAKAKLPVAFGTVEAYVTMMNQGDNDNSLTKCMEDSVSSIQLQITTVWLNGIGGSKHAENIELEIYKLLYPDSGYRYKTSLVIPEANIWKSERLSTQNINYQDESRRVWIRQAIMNNYVSQSS